MAGFELQESPGQLSSPEKDSSSPESNKNFSTLEEGALALAEVMFSLYYSI